MVNFALLWLYSRYVNNVNESVAFGFQSSTPDIVIISHDWQTVIDIFLIKDGVPVLGILGCPNLCWSLADDDKHVDVHDAMPKGCLFVAVKGAGCYQLPLYRKHDGLSIISRKLTVTPSDGSRRPLQQARMCMGVEKYSDARGLTSRMAQLISGSEEEGHILSDRRVDSKVK